MKLELIKRGGHIVCCAQQIIFELAEIDRLMENGRYNL